MLHITDLSTYDDFISFVSSKCSSSLSLYEYRFLDPSISSAFFSMVMLDVDALFYFLLPLYSSTGRPAKFQIEIIRSFILMIHFKFTSFKNWHNTISSDPIYSLLIGCEQHLIPSLSSHYDFLNRLYSSKSEINYLPPNFFSKSNSFKPKKNEKLENVEKGTMQNIVNQYHNDDLNLASRFELPLQKFFHHVAVLPSLNRGLFSNTPTISGDGSALHVHANPNGTKVCNCTGKCSCDRRYSDIDANFGRDSEFGSFYFGYSAYTICTHNSSLKIDLPLFLSMAKASQHDSITSVMALLEFLSISDKKISPYAYCLDFASDNLPTTSSYSERGYPICSASLEMKFDGTCQNRKRHKFICPRKTKDGINCPNDTPCSPSAYGRVVYVNFMQDIKRMGYHLYRSKS